MILESYPWRRLLAKTAKRIRKVKAHRRVRNDTLDVLEMEIMIGFFSIRKLIEARTKLPKEVTELEVCISRSPSLKPLGNYQRYDYFEHFNLITALPARVKLTYLANQIVHSLVFAFTFTEMGKVEGIHFVSEKDQRKFCNYISLESVADLFDEVAGAFATSFAITESSEGSRDWHAT
ncbi:MAG: hypothetical protein EP320_14115 [Rhodobacteraceae bacterium]|nr:MAG: hypothetical protein EP320_14115 [Paracoccaceae bacterium]